MSLSAKHLFLATRPLFFPASMVPIAVGTAWGGPHWQADLFLLALAGMMLLHAAANVLNDVGDELTGGDRLNSDRISPFTGGSRFIQDGRLTLRQMAWWGAGLLLGAAAVGLVLIWIKGLAVLVLGLAGASLAVAYSLRPVFLAARGWGELAVGVGFALPVAAAGWLQSGQVGAPLQLAALAVGCWSAAILIVNEIPDRAADMAVGKRTLVVRWGVAGTVRLYGAVQMLSLLLLAALAVLVQAPVWAMLPPLVGAILVVRLLPLLQGDRAALLTAIRGTLALHLLGGIWLVVLALNCS